MRKVWTMLKGVVEYVRCVLLGSPPALSCLPPGDQATWVWGRLQYIHLIALRDQMPSGPKASPVHRHYQRELQVTRHTSGAQPHHPAPTTTTFLPLLSPARHT